MDRYSTLLRLEWLESTLAFTREKMQLEDVLINILSQLAEATNATKTTDNRLTRLITKSESLLESMKKEAALCRQSLENLQSLLENL